MDAALGRIRPSTSDKRKSSPPRPAGYYRVAGLDLRVEMGRLCRLPVFGGAVGPLGRRLPELTVRRATKRPRSRLGFAILEEWRVSVTAFPGQRPGDVQETLLHELVHLAVGASPGTRRWHGREFKATLREAMREGYGLVGVVVNGSYHGPYADALERRRHRERARGSTSVHPGQLALIGSALSRASSSRSP
jgi:SprT-like family